MTTKSDIESLLKKACHSLGDKIDSSRFKDYLLPLFFLKYLSDVSAEKREKYAEIYKGDREQISQAMNQECFTIEENFSFQALYQQRNDNEIGQKINLALDKMKTLNRDRFFSVVDFHSQVNFGDEEEKNTILKNLLEDFQTLHLRPTELASPEVITQAFESILVTFASYSGGKTGEFTTPSQVSSLLAQLLQPKEEEKIYDPCCGSGGLLLQAFQQVPSGKVQLYGQECNKENHALCNMNLLLHQVYDANIWEGDTLVNPQNVQDDTLMKFHCGLANPPFHLEQWDSGFLSGITGEQEKMSANLDKYKRFELGVPPSSKGDYAFVLHMLSSLDEDCGRMAVILPHGALFRGGSEGIIRKNLLEHNLLDAVIGLPSNLFYGTGIPACILVFRKNRESKDVLFIDGSSEGNFEKGKIQNILRDEDIKRIIQVFFNRNKVDKYSYVASFEEIKENDYNLNIPRYVDTFEDEEQLDLDILREEIQSIERELAEVQREMAECLLEFEV